MCLTFSPALQQLNLEPHEEERTVRREAVTTVPSLGILPPPQPGAREVTSSRGSSAAGPELIAPEFSTAALVP